MTDVQHSDDSFLDIFDAAPIRELVPGEVLIHAGEPARQVFNIVEGMLMVSRVGSDGRRQVLSFLFPDNFVGLTATDEYFFSVEAVTAAKVACRPRRAIDHRLSADSKADRAFLNMVFRVMENLVDLAYSLGQRTANERLAVFVLYLRHRQRLALGISDDADPGLNQVATPMSRSDIADFLGLEKETVSRGFAQLEKTQLIRRDGANRVLIDDLSGLRDLAGVQDFASPMRRPDRARDAGP